MGGEGASGRGTHEACFSATAPGPSLGTELSRWMARKVTALRTNEGADRWGDQLGKYSKSTHPSLLLPLVAPPCPVTTSQLPGALPLQTPFERQALGYGSDSAPLQTWTQIWAPDGGPCSEWWSEGPRELWPWQRAGQWGRPHGALCGTQGPLCS